MFRIPHVRLALSMAALAGLLALLTGLQAEEKPAKPVKTEPAAAAKPVTPKPLSEQVKKGLAYLASQQNEDGGWSQGGGWRTSAQGGGRVEGKQVSDPSDVGNTAIALQALIRAGNTPAEGTYAKNVAKGVEFIRRKVEKSDDKTLSVTDVQGTQLQSKIGAYVDTFLTAMVLAEVKGKMPNAASEKLVLAALNKTVAKIEKNQNEHGMFAGNHGWASVISQGQANKALYRARQVGAKVSDEALAKAEKQVATSFDAKEGTFKASGGGPGGLGGLPGVTRSYALGEPARDKIAVKGKSGVVATGPKASTARVEAALAAPSDAGVAIYSVSAGVGNFQDIANTNRLEKNKARAVLALKDAKPEERRKAETKLQEIEKSDKVRDQAVQAVVNELGKEGFVAGFGSNGGEEFLSFMNISETLVVKGGADWEKWDKTATTTINRVQDKDGSWSGQHCITGKTFCTSSALLVLLADRTPIPALAAAEKVEKKDK